MEGHHRPSGIRLSPSHERWVLSVSAALLASGVLWLIFHYFITVPGEFGDARHPLEAWWMRLHGAAAIGFFVVLGTLLPIHVLRAWQLDRNWHSGAAMLSVACLLSMTGYGLYYAGGEHLRSWISVVHWAIGLAALPALVVHMLMGKRGARHVERVHHPARAKRPTRKAGRSRA